MANARAFGIYDASTGQPVTGAAGGCVVSAWKASTLAPRASPVVTEPRPGLYEIQPTDEDEREGTLILVDTGASHSPRFLVVRAFMQPDQFFAWVHLNPATGALWAGAPPTIGDWSETPAPAITSPTAGVYVVIPSPVDRIADAYGRVAGPAGAIPASLVLDVRSDPIPSPPVITGTTDYAAVETSIQRVIAHALGLPGPSVFWTGQGESPPARAYAELREVSSVRIGLSEDEVRDNAGGPAGQEIILTSRSPLEVVVDVFVYTTNKVNRPAPEGLSAMWRVKGMARVLDGELSASLREAEGIVFVTAGPSRAIPRVLETQYEGRATISLTFRVDDRLEEAVTFIETTELIDEIEDAE